MKSSTGRQELLDMYKERKEMEEEMSQIISYLNGTGLGLSGGLIDSEGFPIADTEKIIDVRTARNRLAMLTTDCKELTKKIEEGLLQVHADARSDAGDEESAPFVLIDAVEENSPASEAGLKVGDAFCSIKGKKNLSLNDVAMEIKISENKSIACEVERNGERIEITLTPHRWSGQGILGCHIVPL